MHILLRKACWALSGLLALLALTGISAARSEDLSTSSGAQLFQHYCASCHGKQGAGDGPVAPFFRLSPPDLRQMSRRNGGTFPTERAHRIIDGRDSLPPHGSREMPVWGLEFAWSDGNPADVNAATAAAIGRLVQHLQSIQLPAKR
jgi:mono/diheme cytochrome c family protein